MKITTGTDIIEVERIKSAVSNPNFRDKVFTPIEIAYCESKNESKYEHYAARFAAKEAVFKAISYDLEDKYDIGWKNIEITNDNDGRPVVKVNADINKKIEIDVSLSHIKEYAIATAIVCKK